MKNSDYDKIQPIGEIYNCLQFEGTKAGIPHVLIRSTGCTHRCFFGVGGICDSWYTSFHPEKGKFSLNYIKEYLEKNNYINHLMLTGGSPTMHPELMNEIINIFHKIHNNNCFITLETEGSHYMETDIPIDLISLSPKFSNSIPQVGWKTPLGKEIDERIIAQHNKFRLNLQLIRQLLAYHKDYHYKPVCNPIEDPNTWKEVEEFRINMSIPKNKTWIMPPGDNRNELIRVYPQIIEFCTINGFNFSGRDHILAFGDIRGV